jgi:mRNA-degrading endonuclease RelE of RelBE toxin-antitoxin system/PHD/YefM family antitoxin component YafN of YafNO toxin-antitoxin module
MEKRLEILDQPPDVRALVGECELTGNRTVFTRNGRAVVTLISNDEYVALHETLEIANDPALRAQIEAAEREVERNEILLAEELTGVRTAEDRLRLAESVERSWQMLNDDKQISIAKAFAFIDDDPISGAPLFDPLRSLWSYRLGDARVVYRIVPEARFVVILAIT